MHVEPQRRVAALHDAHRAGVRPYPRRQPERLLRSTTQRAFELHHEGLEYVCTEAPVITKKQRLAPVNFSPSAIDAEGARRDR